MAIVISEPALQNSSATPLRRMRGQDGEPITIASVSSLSYEVWDISVPTVPVEIINQTALTPISDFIFDTPINDARWTVDNTGYNFRLILPTTALPKAVNHALDVKFVWANGDPDVILRFNLQALPSFHDGP